MFKFWKNDGTLFSDGGVDKMKIISYEFYTIINKEKICENKFCEVENRYLINLSSGQWLENYIDDCDRNYVCNIVEKHNGFIDFYMGNPRFTFKAEKDAQSFLDSEEMLPIITMIELTR